MELLIGIIYIGTIVYLANVEEATGHRQSLLRPLLYGIVGLIGYVIFSTFVLMVMPIEALESLASDVTLPTIDVGIGVLFIGVALINSLLMITILRSESFRIVLVKLFSRQSRKSKTISYRPHSIVHTTAMILALFMMTMTFWTFLISQDTQITATPNDLILNLVLYLLMAFLGVGLFLRRTWQQVVDRLGLSLPNLKSIFAGVAVAISAYIMLIVVSSIWIMLAGEETVAEQTALSHQLFEAFSGTIWLGILLATTTAIGEEILFRGALQPIFGNLATSLFFVAVHFQYTLTPAMIILLVISLSFGWLRQRYGTTSAIIAHFTYNLIPFLLLNIAQTAPTGGV